MSSLLTLDDKIRDLEEFLRSGAYLQARRGKGTPFVDLLYPPEEEPRCPDAVRALAERLKADDWRIDLFQPEPLLYGFLRERGKLGEVLASEREGEGGSRARIAARQFESRLAALGREDRPKSAVLVCRTGGFYPHIGIYPLQECLVSQVKRTMVFFLPATEIDATSFLFLGTQRTQKYRAHYI